MIFTMRRVSAMPFQFALSGRRAIIFPDWFFLRSGFNSRSPGGERLTVFKQGCPDTCFNSRSPGGERSVIFTKQSQEAGFNSRSPGGERSKIFKIFKVD